jgi:hypothetical protein
MAAERIVVHADFSEFIAELDALRKALERTLAVVERADEKMKPPKDEGDA